MASFEQGKEALASLYVLSADSSAPFGLFTISQIPMLTFSSCGDITRSSDRASSGAMTSVDLLSEGGCPLSLASGN